MDRSTAPQPLVATLISTLDEARIRWVLLRGRAGLEVTGLDATGLGGSGLGGSGLGGSGLGGSGLVGSGLGTTGRDLDVLVDGEDLAALEEAVFALGGMALPRGLHPWHRFYRLPDRGRTLTLDVVTRLIYRRRLPIRSGLEAGCLQRRRHDGACWVLDPTDLLWTVLLHCVLDKQAVSERRSAELQGALPQLVRPSPGEDFFTHLCPPGWSADRALGCVAAGDWPALAGLGRQLSPAAPPRRRRGPAVTVVRRAADLAVRAARSVARRGYPMAWRRAGLGATPQLLDVADASGIDLAVAAVRRRPGRRDLVVLTADDQASALAAALRRHRYRPLAGRWSRPTPTGIERVRPLSPGQLALPGTAWSQFWDGASPVPGRTHSRRLSAASAQLVAGSAQRQNTNGRL